MALVTGGDRLLLLRNRAGMWGFPGGWAEPTDPDPWSTAHREALEECGADFVYSASDPIDVIELERAPASPPPDLYVVFVMKHPGGAPRLSQEHDRYRWVHLHDLSYAPTTPSNVHPGVILAAARMALTG